jgi:hypothetical protein
MTRMISRDYHFRYHSAYYIVYHRFLPKTYTKLFSITGCCFCCCCFQCNFPYLIVGIRAWFAGYKLKKRFFADLSILFVRHNKYKKNKTRFNMRTILGFTLVNREFDSINLRTHQTSSSNQPIRTKIFPKKVCFVS